MRTPFRETERSAIQDNGEQERLQKTVAFEENETKDTDVRPDTSTETETPEKNVCKPDSEERVVDDEGNAVNDNEQLPPNKSFRLNGIEYKTDDNGRVYSIDGKLLPDSEYQLNGTTYVTDSKGRIVREHDPKIQKTPDNVRDGAAQRQAGGADRRENDQGGHIVGRDLGGDPGSGNMVAMDGRINQSDYKRMENDIKAAVDEGKEVSTTTEITYSDDSERPDRIRVTVTIDGKETVYVFDNNLDGSLIDEVPDNGKETVKDVAEMTGGIVSSVKMEYDREGNLERTTITITYTNEDGENRRVYVKIDGQAQEGA